MARQIVVEVDEGTARELERIPPARRQAVDAEERRMAEASLRQPDDAAPEVIDPGAWETRNPAFRRRLARRPVAPTPADACGDCHLAPGAVRRVPHRKSA